MPGIARYICWKYATEIPEMTSATPCCSGVRFKMAHFWRRTDRVRRLAEKTSGRRATRVRLPTTPPVETIIQLHSNLYYRGRKYTYAMGYRGKIATLMESNTSLRRRQKIRRLKVPTLVPLDHEAPF